MLEDTTPCHVKIFAVMDTVQVMKDFDHPWAGFFVRSKRRNARGAAIDTWEVAVQSIENPHHYLHIPRSQLEGPEDPMPACVKMRMKWHMKIANHVHTFVAALIHRHNDKSFIDETYMCIDDEWVESKGTEMQILFLHNPKNRYDFCHYLINMDMRSIEEENTVLKKLVSEADFRNPTSSQAWKFLEELKKLGAIDIKMTSWGASDQNHQYMSDADCTPSVDWQCAICQEDCSTGDELVNTCDMCTYHAKCLVKYVSHSLVGLNTGVDIQTQCALCRSDIVTVKSYRKATLQSTSKVASCGDKRKIQDSITNKTVKKCKPSKRALEKVLAKEKDALSMVQYNITKVHTIIEENVAYFKDLVKNASEIDAITHERVCFASCLCDCVKCTSFESGVPSKFMTEQTSYESMVRLAAHLRALNIMQLNFDNDNPNNIIKNKDDCDMRIIGPWRIVSDGSGEDEEHKNLFVKWRLHIIDDIHEDRFICSSKVQCIVVNMKDSSDRRVVDADRLFLIPGDVF